jgi:hypothetical protein
MQRPGEELSTFFVETAQLSGNWVEPNTGGRPFGRIVLNATPFRYDAAVLKLLQTCRTISLV